MRILQFDIFFGGTRKKKLISSRRKSANAYEDWFKLLFLLVINSINIVLIVLHVTPICWIKTGRKLLFDFFLISNELTDRVYHTPRSGWRGVDMKMTL